MIRMYVTGTQVIKKLRNILGIDGLTEYSPFQPTAEQLTPASPVLSSVTNEIVEKCLTVSEPKPCDREEFRDLPRHWSSE